jgi:hypothetical protein
VALCSSTARSINEYPYMAQGPSLHAVDKQLALDVEELGK